MATLDTDRYEECGNRCEPSTAGARPKGMEPGHEAEATAAVEWCGIASPPLFRLCDPEVALKRSICKLAPERSDSSRAPWWK
jgi:hypothetical protein